MDASILQGVVGGISSGAAEAGITLIAPVLFKKLQAMSAKIEKNAKEEVNKIPSIERQSAASQIHLEKTASLFWLGNDLMWIIDMMLRGALPDRILDGIRGAIQYANTLGFPEYSPVHKHLTDCHEIISNLLGLTGSNDDEIQRLEQGFIAIYQKVERVKWYVDAIVKVQEPDFKKQRSFPRRKK
jgi:hypothetical protein